MKFNVGDIVALSPDKNPYKYPGISQAYHWLGIVTEVEGRRFTAKTVQHVYEWCMDDIIKNLDERDFDFVRSSIVQPKVVSTMPKDNPVSHPTNDNRNLLRQNGAKDVKRDENRDNHDADHQTG